MTALLMMFSLLLNYYPLNAFSCENCWDNTVLLSSFKIKAHIFSVLFLFVHKLMNSHYFINLWKRKQENTHLIKININILPEEKVAAIP